MKYGELPVFGEPHVKFYDIGSGVKCGLNGWDSILKKRMLWGMNDCCRIRIPLQPFSFKRLVDPTMG